MDHRCFAAGAAAGIKPAPLPGKEAGRIGSSHRHRIPDRPAEENEKFAKPAPRNCQQLLSGAAG
ncbi:MAG: hypothetical protein OEV91_11615 [Desulfobulbaceae bacterium]|nr:hypothetical protein [Desulfobulbaceae bacterium]